MNTDRLIGLIEQAKVDPNPKLFQEIHFELDLLEYQTRPRLGFESSVPPVIDAHCSVEWCKATTLINFNGKWWCSAHEPPFDSSFGSPVGYPVPKEPQVEKAKDMADRWAKYRDRLNEAV